MKDIKSGFGIIAQLACAAMLILTIAGCATYYIPLESFKKQFNGIDSTKLRMVTIDGAGIMKISYPANQIDTIECVDDKNKPVLLPNGPSIEMRLTDNNDESTIFYFDTVYLQDSLLIGSRSRFLPLADGSVLLKNVKLIEVQDGKKNFHYINNKH